jgi:hypothetical protein
MKTDNSRSKELRKLLLIEKSKCYLDVDRDGNKIQEWLLPNGLRHREFGPAKTTNFGLFYYQNGQLHREKGPATITYDGSRHYYKNDKLHRETGPAVILVDGTKMYYWHGEMCLSFKELKIRKNNEIIIKD